MTYKLSKIKNSERLVNCKVLMENFWMCGWYHPVDFHRIFEVDLGQEVFIEVVVPI